MKRFDPLAFRTARIAAGLTPYALALRVGVSRQAITRWESGQSLPTPGHLLLARTILDVTPEQLGLPPVDKSTLAELRERAGRGVAELAAELGTNPTTFHEIEIGFAPIPDRLLADLSVALRLRMPEVQAGWQLSRDALAGN